MPEVVPFNVYSAATGAPLAGVVNTFNFIKRRELNGSYTNLAPGPAISDKGGGAYEFSLDSSQLTPGTIVKYIIDCTAAAASRYLEGVVRASDAGFLEGTAQVGPFDEILLDVGDQAPPFTFVLRDQDGVAINLTTGSPAVTISMWPAEGGAPIMNAIACTIVDAPSGIVRVDWPLGASAAAGSFFAKFALTQNNVVSQHPVNRSIVVRVLKVAP